MTEDLAATINSEVDAFMRITRRFKYCDGDECEANVDDIDIHLLEKFHSLSDMAKIRVITGHCNLCVNTKPTKDIEAIKELVEIDKTNTAEITKLQTKVMKVSVGAVVTLLLLVTLYIFVVRDMPDAGFLDVTEMVFKVIKVIIGE